MLVFTVVQIVEKLWTNVQDMLSTSVKTWEQGQGKTQNLPKPILWKSTPAIRVL